MTEPTDASVSETPITGKDAERDAAKTVATKPTTANATPTISVEDTETAAAKSVETDSNEHETVETPKET